MKGLPNTCHNYRTEGFQIPIKPCLFENHDLFGNPVVTLYEEIDVSEGRGGEGIPLS